MTRGGHAARRRHGLGQGSVEYLIILSVTVVGLLCGDCIWDALSGSVAQSYARWLNAVAVDVPHPMRGQH